MLCSLKIYYIYEVSLYHQLYHRVETSHNRVRLFKTIALIAIHFHQPNVSVTLYSYNQFHRGYTMRALILKLKALLSSLLTLVIGSETFMRH